MGEKPSPSGEDFSLVSAARCRHKVAKAHRHKEKKGQRDKGVKAQSRKIRPLCPFVPQAVGFSPTAVDFFHYSSIPEFHDSVV
jgi:hypothetical protein